MNMFNVRILSSILVMSIFGVTSAGAAPSVKMLGANNARVGANATVVKSSANTGASTQRLGSIRSKTVSSGTPVTVNKVSTPSVSTSSASTAAATSGSEARLSLGKYIHSTGINAGTIKPAGSSNAGVSSNDFVALSDQVKNLKDTKQDAISAGDGLVLDESTISLDSSAVQAQVEDALEDYYTKGEINTKIANIAAGDMSDVFNGKQDAITDLEDIRDGAAAGATAVQPDALNDYALKTSIPSKTSELDNDSGYLTEHQDISGKADKDELPSKVSELENDAGFLTEEDISGKADKDELPSKVSELENDAGFLTEQDISGKADAADVYTKDEVDVKVANIVAGDMAEALNNYALKTSVPSKTSELDNDSGYLTEHQDISGKADKEDLPTKVSELDNDAGYLTETDLSGYATTESLSGYATTESLSDYATTESLSGYATTEALNDYATKSALDDKADASALNNYLTTENAAATYQLKGAYVSAPDLPTSSGDYLLMVNRGDNGAYSYSWESASNFSSGSGSSNDDDDEEIDLPGW